MSQSDPAQSSEPQLPPGQAPADPVRAGLAALRAALAATLAEFETARSASMASHEQGNRADGDARSAFRRRQVARLHRRVARLAVADLDRRRRRLIRQACSHRKPRNSQAGA